MNSSLSTGSLPNTPNPQYALYRRDTMLVPRDGEFSVPQCKAMFDAWLSEKGSLPTRQPVIHISLNPHPDDRLSDGELVEIGEKYMERLGYGNTPFVIFKHEDLEREHIHIVGVRVDANGKLINNSFEHRRSKEITEQLEREYNLHPAESNERKLESWQLTPIDAGAGDLNRQVASVVNPIVNLYRFQTIGEYRALLTLYNIGVEEVKGERKGKPYRGLLYCPLDSDGHKTGMPLKSSLIGKTVGYDAIEKRMAQSAEKVKAEKAATRAIVAEAMRHSNSEEEFRQKLKEKNVDLFIRRNGTGRVYGITFIDHNSRCVMNGSRLGREFSANVFHEWFDNGLRPNLPETVGANTQTTATDQRQTRHWQENTRSQDTHTPEQVALSNMADGATGLTDSLLSVFTPETGYDDINNRPERWLPKKKKKRRYGRQI
jgi:hypothetical protein